MTGLAGPGECDTPELAAEQMYAALGYVVRELGIAHDLLAAIAAGVTLESLPGVVADVAVRVDRVYHVAAELRGRWA